jgi:hypothetical protein
MNQADIPPSLQKGLLLFGRKQFAYGLIWYRTTIGILPAKSREIRAQGYSAKRFLILFNLGEFYRSTFPNRRRQLTGNA